MFDIIVAVAFTFVLLGLMIYAFKPVMDTMKRDELERKQKKQNDHTVHPA